MSSNGMFKIWRCCEPLKGRVGCKARIHTDLDDNFIKETGTHICVKSESRPRNPRNSSKHKLETDYIEGPSSKIMNRTLRSATKPKIEPRISVDDDSAAEQFVVKSLPKKRVRSKPNQIPALPENVRDLEIPKPYKIYLYQKEGGMEGEMEEEQFLLSDSDVYEEGGDQRILLFARASTAGWIDQIQQIFVDGTIPVAPILFEQFYLIMARRGAWVFPICYCLLTSK
ncbi:hypothetical protein Mgra_00004526, partial [Meloidogyne graminicola]